MNIKIIPEMWNTLTPQQKRICASNMQTERLRLKLDRQEITAWVSVVTGVLIATGFATMLLR